MDPGAPAKTDGVGEVDIRWTWEALVTVATIECLVLGCLVRGGSGEEVVLDAMWPK